MLTSIDVFQSLTIPWSLPGAEILVRTLDKVSANDVLWLLDSSNNLNIGFSSGHKMSKLIHFQLATDSRVLLIKVMKAHTCPPGLKSFFEGTDVFAGYDYRIVGDHMQLDVLFLFVMFGIRVRQALSFSSNLLGLFTSNFNSDAAAIKKEEFRKYSKWNTNAPSTEHLKWASIRSIMAFHCGSVHESDSKAILISAVSILKWKLDMAYEILKTVNGIKNGTEKYFAGDFDKSKTQPGFDNSMHILNSRYRTRIRRGHKMEVTTSDGKTHSALAIHHEGKSSYIKMNKSHKGHEIVSIKVDGSSDVSVEDKAMLEIVKSVFQDFKFHELIKQIFAETSRKVTPIPVLTGLELQMSLMGFDSGHLNDAQVKAIKMSLDFSSRITMIKGPPGTGKTTVISNVINRWNKIRKEGEQAICTARSNIAVKNIAESLLKIGFLDFSLCVSEEFYLEWHEHLYKNDERLSARLIQSSNMRDNPTVENSAVVLCTLATIKESKTVTLLIVDEASQTFIGSYVDPICKLSVGLKKVVFFGDEKQLPPYGSSSVKVKSVFDLKLANSGKNCVFLNLQYRMPHAIADFLSKQIYNKKLLNGLPDLLQPSIPIFWHHVAGQEEKQGKSSINVKEAEFILKLTTGISQTTAMKDLTILTGYDGQQNCISKLLEQHAVRPNFFLKEASERVFNVDSFQGQESQIVIVSLTRTRNFGFLADAKRTNVMLSRMQKKLILVGDINLFLQDKFNDKLISKMAQLCRDSGLVKY